MHETEVQCEKACALGIVLDGKRLETRARKIRLCGVRSAIGTALRRRRMSGRELEVLLGHCTYLALVKRPLLSCFHASYRYVQPTNRTKTAHRSTVVDELTHFRALTFFCFSQWWPPWSTDVFSTDASLQGYGLAASDWARSEVAEAGRRKEPRDRGVGSMLENTLRGRWVLSSIMSAIKFVKAAPDDKASIPLMGADEMGRRTPGFEETPPSLLVGSRWRALGGGRHPSLGESRNQPDSLESRQLPTLLWLPSFNFERQSQRSACLRP